MSMPTPIPVTCPGCQHEQDFTAWRSLNVTLDRDRKADVVSGKLTRFTCDQCGHTAEVVYPMLYHDMERRLMVWMLPKDPDAPEPAEEETPPPPAEMGVSGEGYVFRRVTTRNELVEKVFVVDHGLDDRVVELVKVILWEQMPEEKKPDGTALLFTDLVEEGDGPRLAFTILGPCGNQGVSVPRDPMYHGCEESFVASQSQPPGWPTIDRDYAVSLIERAGEPASASTGPSGGRPARSWWQFWR